MNNTCPWCFGKKTALFYTMECSQCEPVPTGFMSVGFLLHPPSGLTYDRHIVFGSYDKAILFSASADLADHTCVTVATRALVKPVNDGHWPEYCRLEKDHRHVSSAKSVFLLPPHAVVDTPDGFGFRCVSYPK